MTRDLEEVRRWGETLIRQLSAEPLPIIGSREWVAAPGPVRLAAAVRAAIAWTEDADPHRLAIEVEAELEAARRYDEGDYRGWVQIARQVRASADAPSFVELQRRRSA